MKPKTLCAWALLGVFIVMSAPCAVFAQDSGAPPPAVVFSEQQLDQMLSPVALYPDSLLAQILIAATYPDQVMDADNWVHAHPGLRGEALNAELDRMSWDLSIKALVPFPEVLDMLAREPDWMQQLGEAFLAQQGAVMDSVQRLRRRAQEAGNLRSTPQQRVVVTDDYVEIQPADPTYVYIPRYNPAVVYGNWWWPSYPPLAYYPVWPGPVVAFTPLVGVFGFWGAVTVGPAWGWGWGRWGWGSHNVFVNVNRNININTRNVTVINRWQNNFRYANARNMALAGRVGAPAIRTRAFGTSRANPAALRGQINTGRVTRGQLVTPAGVRPGMSGPAAARGAVGARPGYNGRGYGATPMGARPGYGHPGYGRQGPNQRPSPNQVMNELKGGRPGASGRSGSYGTGRAQGNPHGGTGHTPQGVARGYYNNSAHAVPKGNYGGASHTAPHGNVNAPRQGGAFGGGAFHGAPRGGYGGASHTAPHGNVNAPRQGGAFGGGAFHGAPRGNYGAPSHAAPHGNFGAARPGGGGPPRGGPGGVPHGPAHGAGGPKDKKK
ncbi:MAG: DUF3300 domain-containing protein [Syntrophobacteraceae bacterium]